jgi:predicted dehydrogenase
VANTGNWTIIGDNPVAEALREASRFVETTTPITLATEPGDIPKDAFAIGPTILATQVERIVPYYLAYEAIGEVKRALDAGEVGRVYGCFTSFRIARGHDGESVAHNALLPALGVTLHMLPAPITRVHATRASLLAGDDAWFVTLRLADETIVTIEALAVLDPAEGLGRDILIEVTGSERVLRAEPNRQSVVVESLGAATRHHPWWEDLNERFLKLLAEQATTPPTDAGTRLRAAWSAIQQSADSGKPVVL